MPEVSGNLPEGQCSSGRRIVVASRPATVIRTLRSNPLASPGARQWAAYRWPLLRYRSWLLSHHRGGVSRISVLLSQKRVESFLLQESDPSRPAPQTRASTVGTLCRFSGWLSARGHTKSDLLRSVVRPKAASRPLPRFLGASQVERLLSGPDTTDPLGIRDRSILETIYASWVRRAELCSLLLSDLDFETHQILVRHGKGDRQRLIPAGARAFEWITRYLAATRKRLAASNAPTSPLYVTGYGDAFSPSSLGQLVRRYLDQAGITIQGSTHLLRHSCATHMHDRGAGLRVIQRILGHSRLDTTAIYTHVSVAKLAELHARYHPHGDQAQVI